MEEWQKDLTLFRKEVLLTGSPVLALRVRFTSSEIKEETTKYGDLSCDQTMDRVVN